MGRHKGEDHTLDNRNADMVERRLQGFTLQSIGDIYGLTRERVRQLVVKGTNSPAGKERTEKFLELAQPFLDNTPNEVCCFLCGEELPTTFLSWVSKGRRKMRLHPKRKSMCETCRDRVYQIRRCAAYVRLYRRGGDKRYLATALHLARKYEIAPEMLRLG